MSRAAEWSSLGYGWLDPTPGNGAAIRKLSRDLAKKSRNVNGLVKGLKSVAVEFGKANSIFEGEAAAKFREKLSTLPGELSGFANSFNGVSKALNDWSNTVDMEQESASDILKHAKEAKKRLVSAQMKYNEAKNALGPVEMDYKATQCASMRVAQSETLDKLLREKQTKYEAARSQVDQFHSELQNAVDDLKAQARKAEEEKGEYGRKAANIAKRIQDCVGDMPQVSWWEQIYYSEAWACLLKAAEVVSIIVGVLTLISSSWLLFFIGLAYAALMFANSAMARAAGDISDLEFGLSFAILFLTCCGLPKAIANFKAGGMTNLLGFKGESGLKVVKDLKSIGSKEAKAFREAFPRRSGTSITVKEYNRFVHRSNFKYALRKELPLNLLRDENYVKLCGGDRSALPKMLKNMVKVVKEIEHGQNEASKSSRPRNMGERARLAYKAVGVAFPGVSLPGSALDMLAKG